MPDMIYAAIAALLGSAGFWAYMTTRAKLSAQRQTADNVSLRDMVHDLSGKLDRYTEEKEELLREIGLLRAELSAAQATIQHLEAMLRHA